MSSRGRDDCGKDSLNDGASGCTSDPVLRASRQRWVAFVSAPFGVVYGERAAMADQAIRHGRMDGWNMYNRVFLLCYAAKDPAMLDERRSGPTIVSFAGPNGRV